VIYRGDAIRLAILPVTLPRVAIRDGWHAPRYGQRVRAPVVEAEGLIAPGTTFGYVILRDED
jgi:hypothetical protein